MVYRTKKSKNYTTMSNYHLRDKKLSLKAKGLLSMFLSLPDEWTYSLAGIVNICAESEGAIKSILKELKACGYLEIVKERTEKGTYEYIYNIYEKPHTEKPYMDKPTVEEPRVENPPLAEPWVENQGQLNTNILNTKQLKKDKSIKDNKYKALGEIADDKLRDTLADFINHRKALKRPLTENALNLIIKKLNKMANDNDTKIAILEQSIENGWIGIFELKGNKNKKAEELDDFYKMAQAFGKGDI